MPTKPKSTPEDDYDEPALGEPEVPAAPENPPAAPAGPLLTSPVAPTFTEAQMRQRDPKKDADPTLVCTPSGRSFITYQKRKPE